MACSYKMKDAAGAWQTITGKPAMMAALADGRLDHLLPAGVVRAMTATAAAAPKETPAQRPAPAPTPNTIFTEDAATKARELLRRKLGQLNSGLDPEMLQAGITLAGYHIEKGARSFSAYAQAMLADLGDAVRPYLKSWYMGVKYDPRAAGFEGMDTAATVEAADENEINKEPENAPSTDGSVERNRQEPASERAVGDAVPDEGRGAGEGARDAGGQARRSGRRRQPDGAGVPADRPAAGGERGDQQLPAGNPADLLEDIAAGSRFRERGSDTGFDGVSADPIPASQVEAAAGAGAAIVPRLAQQRAAEKLTVVPGDLENIRATLPYLLPEQQEDVLKAEQRLSKPDGYGMLFTNGTGTGKTFTGLGVVKRAVRQGKTNILIAVPSDKIAADWIESGVPLGLEISKLKDTKDAGRGIVVTTYANLGANDALAGREWDMVVVDEAHKLMQAEDGTPTTYLENLRAITLHPDGAHQRYAMLNREDIDRMKALSSQIDSNNRIASADDTMDEVRASLAKENAGLEKEHKALADKLARAREEVRGYVAERQGAARPRLVALSATPFAYMKTVDWANGYLFDYHEGQPEDGASGTGGRPYNSGSNRERFFMQHFGYSMLYNKLNEPDPKKVDVGLLQRQFNAWLKKKGSLSGRQLEVAADYDRRFVLVDSAIGNQIDEAMNWLSENARNAPKDDRGFYELRDRINDKFDYLSRRYLLEAIKATEAIPIVKAHMAMGRKVIVFHDYLQGGGFNPFNVPPMTVSADGNAEDRARAEQFNAALRQFNAKFSALVNAPLGEMTSPIDVFKRELPQVLLINGSENPKEKLKRYKVFQDDASGPQVMLVQSAQNAGWSGHDTTGKHQRVLINIGQPTAPTMAIQQEGRIYRVGQVSNAIMRYLNTGTSWEKWAFAQTIATRASAAENLGAGELSRALKDSFIAAFEESDAYPPGHEGEGTGGKERDKAQNNALTAYDRAKTFYWATQKKNSKTKAQEGVDYFATPEPLGFKMVEWLGLRGGEDALEPSGGHGAIARWLPDSVQRTVIEPSPALRSRLAMVMDLGNDRIIDGTFEELANVNKFDGIVMNPPFGVGGKTAIEHLAKAAAHLRDGGRVVALIPTGPAADKRFEKWMNGEETREVKPLFEHPTLGPIYRGDTIESRAAWAPSGVVMRTNRDGGLWVKVPGRAGETTVSSESITGIAAQGPRSETYRPAEGLHQVAEVRLPQVTFERAGTAVATRIVVIDKHRDPTKAPNPRSPIDLTGISDIRELFDRLENMDLPARSMTAEQEASAKAEQGKPAAAADQTPATTQPAAGQDAPQGPAIERKGRKIVKHVTKNGKTLRGIVATDITKDQAQEIDPYTFKKDGGWFIRERHVKDDAGPKFSREAQAPDDPAPAGITYDTLPAAFAKRFPKLEGAVKTMLHRGALGRKGGLVVLDSNDSADIAREFASRTGWDYRETMEMFESVDGAGVHGIYDPKTGTIFAVGPNLDEASLPAVILHEAIHGQQRASVDTKAQALLEGRAKEAPALRAFLDRVAVRMEEVGETGNRFEVAPYIVEMAVMEGRAAGFSAADGPILAWIEKNIGRKAADLVRDFVATLRAWALRNGVPLKSVAVDDLVAYAMAGVGRAARGEVVTLGKAVASKGGTYGKIGGMDDANNVAGKQAPTPAGDVEGSAQWAYEAYQSGVVPDGWYVHGRAGRGDLNTNNVLQLTKSWDVADQYAGRTGSKWLIRPTGDASELDLSDSDTTDMDRVVSAALDDFDRGRLSWLDDLEGALGRDADESDVEDAVRSEFAPDDIVDTAKAYDNQAMSEWLAYRFDYPSFVKTPDGAVVFSREGIESVRVPNEPPASASSDASPKFSRSAPLRAATKAATSALNDTLTAPGKLSWWHKTVGTMYNLAERSPAFAPVFKAAQSFIDDVSHYANDAAEMAPKLLPKLDAWRDIWKSPISAADNVAIAKPVFEGTLLWGRDAAGRAVKVAELSEAAEKMSIRQKADRLMGTGAISGNVHKMWLGLPVDQYEKNITTSYEGAFLQPGIVWKDAELRSLFGLNDKQVELYKEFRRATDRSLDMMARADMLRYGGQDAKPIREAVMDAPDVEAAAIMLRDHFGELAKLDPERETLLLDTANAMMDRADKVLKLQKQGYAPLSRFGRYTVDVVVDGERQYFGLYETAREANRAAGLMRQEFGAGAVTQGTLSNEAFKMFAGITPETLELFGNALGLDSTGDEARDKAFQEYLRLTKSNRSAMKRMIHRQGIAGYSEDVARVLASFVYSNARQTAAGLHMGDLGEAVQKIPKEEGELKDVAFRLADYVKNPQEEAQAIRGLLFAQYLGGSIASAFVNMTQPAAVTFPWLSQFGGAKAAAAQLAKAAADMAKKRYEPALAKALHAAEEDGTVSPQEVHQLMAQAQGGGALRIGDGTKAGDALAQASNGFKRMAFAWGKVFSMAEQVNRRMTFIAAYRTAQAQGMPHPEQFARKAVQETQFVYSKASKQQWGRGAVGGTLMTFKTYSIAYLELLHRMATQGGPEGKKAALLALGMLMLMGGAGGLPFASDAEDIAEALARMLGYNISVKKARQELLEDAFGRDIAGFIDKGITGLPGVPLDISGRLGMGNLIPGTGLLQPKTDHTSDVLEILGPAGDLAKRAFDAGGRLLRGDITGAALQASPVAARNLAKGADMAATGMYRDAKGYKVLDTDTLEAALKAVGFQPKSVATIQEANAEAQQAKNFYSLRAQEIRMKWAQGIFEGDQGKVQEAREAIADWNEKNPDQRMVITVPSVLKKVREMRKPKDERIAATAPKAMRASLREELGKVREGL